MRSVLGFFFPPLVVEYINLPGSCMSKTITLDMFSRLLTLPGIFWQLPIFCSTMLVSPPLYPVHLYHGSSQSLSLPCPSMEQGRHSTTTDHLLFGWWTILSMAVCKWQLGPKAIFSLFTICAVPFSTVTFDHRAAAGCTFSSWRTVFSTQQSHWGF